MSKIKVIGLVVIAHVCLLTVAFRFQGTKQLVAPQIFLGSGNPNTNQFATNGSIGALFIDLADYTQPRILVKSSTNGYVQVSPPLATGGDFVVVSNLTVQGSIVCNNDISTEGKLYAGGLTSLDGGLDMAGAVISDSVAGYVTITNNLSIGGNDLIDTGSIYATNTAHFGGGGEMMGAWNFNGGSLSGLDSTDSTNLFATTILTQSESARNWVTPTNSAPTNAITPIGWALFQQGTNLGRVAIFQ